MQAVFLCLLAIAIAANAQSDTCTMCTGVVLYAENYLQENQTEKFLFSVIQPMCNYLPSPYNAECVHEIDTEGPAIIADIIAKEPPKTVCTQVGLCTAAKTAKLVKVAEKPKPTKTVAAKAPLDNCATCQTVISFLEAFISDNTTEAEVAKFLTQDLCPSLHISSSVCAQIANEIPAIVQALDNDLPPKQICILIKLCTSFFFRANLDVNCEICEFAVGQIESYIATNATETQIENALNQACALLGSYAATCRQVVADVPQYIAELEQAQPPNVICTEVGVCTSKSKKQY
jgi:saposin